MSCKPILVVEDDVDIREQLKIALEMEGYSVMSAENGQCALDLLLSLEPDLLPGCILLDLMMPVMDGNVFVSTIESKYPNFRDIKIIVATAKGSPISSDHLPKHVDRIQKPMELDELYEVIGKHCGPPEHT